MHGKAARIDIDPDDMEGFIDPANRHAISKKLRTLGFSHVAVDLEGYQQGSMNRL